MRKHKTKIIAGIIILAVLAVSLLWGGFGEKPDVDTTPDAASTRTEQASDTSPDSPIVSEDPATPIIGNRPESPATLDESEEASPSKAGTVNIQPNIPNSTPNIPNSTPSMPDPPPSMPNSPPSIPNSQPSIPNSQPNIPASVPYIPVSPPSVILEQTPIPPDASGADDELTCTLIISCATVLDNLSSLRDGKEEIIPQDGIVFSKTVVFYEGESVFDVLRRETKSGRIHLEYVNAPLYGSAYIEGIGNLYEFDCGERSGWMYRVNGEFPNYGSSKYTLSAGDKIEWLYTCDRGADIGGADAADSYINE